MIYEPKPGDLLFVRGTSLISKAIMFFLGSKFSHVAIFIEPGLIIESDWLGVVVSKSEKYAGKEWYCEVVSENFSGGQRLSMVSWLKSKIGDEYDYPLFAGSFFGRIINRARNKKGLWDNSKKWICSELAAGAFQVAGWKFKTPISQISPKELYYASLPGALIFRYGEKI